MRGRPGATHAPMTGRRRLCNRRPCRCTAASARMKCWGFIWSRRRCPLPRPSERRGRRTWARDFAKGWHDALASGVVSGTASAKSDVRLRRRRWACYTPCAGRCGAHRAVPPGPKPVGRSFRQQCVAAGTAAAADQAGVGQSAADRAGPCQANAARKWRPRAFERSARRVL